jgi:hypothetical protein
VTGFVGAILRAVRPSDTSLEGHAAQLKAYRRLGSARRSDLAGHLSADTRRLTRAGIRARHPEYTDEQTELALRRLLYGDELFQRAWPGRPFVAP